MSSKSRLILSLQFLLLGAYSVVLWGTDAQSIFQGELGAGVTLVLVGAVVLALAVIAYRKAVGTYKVKPTPEPSERGELITRGVYSVIRHPFYTATPIVLAGMALIVRRPWALTVIPLVIGLLYWKSSYEEKLLEARFPEYPEYRKKTGRFLPRLRKM